MRVNVCGTVARSLALLGRLFLQASTFSSTVRATMERKDRLRRLCSDPRFRPRFRSEPLGTLLCSPSVASALAVEFRIDSRLQNLLSSPFSTEWSSIVICGTSQSFSWYHLLGKNSAVLPCIFCMTKLIAPP